MKFSRSTLLVISLASSSSLVSTVSGSDAFGIAENSALGIGNAFSGGAASALADDLSIDAGYAHIFVPNTKINRAGSTGEALVGEYESDADILSDQLRWDM